MTEQRDDVTAELERLRALVGPDERSYRELAADVERAQAAARHAEADVGRLRGTILEMQTQLIRARQDQERYQRLLDARRRLADRWSAATRRLRSLRRSR